MKNNKNIIIITLLVVIAAMAVAYSAFATQLTINGQSQIVREWNVKIIGIEAQDVSEGCDEGTPTFTNSTATFSAKLKKPGDSITYQIIIKNLGTIDATLSSAKFTPDDEKGSPAITYIATKPSDSLKAGETTTVTITVTYNADITEVPSITTKTITGIIEYVQD